MKIFASFLIIINIISLSFTSSAPSYVGTIQQQFKWWKWIIAYELHRICQMSNLAWNGMRRASWKLRKKKKKHSNWATSFMNVFVPVWQRVKCGKVAVPLLVRVLLCNWRTMETHPLFFFSLPDHFSLQINKQDRFKELIKEGKYIYLNTFMYCL